ncbi:MULTISPECIES: DNA mismatch repair protein [Vibrio]|uniref:DNA mismatch repair protein n=1 Tax=Vibrio TaxID=662 RepID=UPI001D8E4B91|nr:DNA mismatch repair protein [Vibrio sp. A1-1]EGR1604158.1 DNA mismatch repair protein [Vibrio parahaemolyticus]ELI3524314.1 DNA mismatch repair protein [Vibrio vulnificus]EGR1629555.1 DNA mismatch repair protein [Vibrio parahaemolyticus]EGR1649708.1 DNA mismatch repair protein [Vibrio parahaemolyticus]EHU0358691.1 DNA mismatch repair protein [Vibrio parahaemolyticus]
MNGLLKITEEKDRKNTPISSALYGRVSIFHPSQRLTPNMKARLVEVAQSGGTDLNNPLESADLEYKGEKFRIGLHVDYLLHPHRDVLEMIISYARTVQLHDESFDNGQRLTWFGVLSSISGIRISNPEKEKSDIINSEATVFSISMYDLAKLLKISPTRKNYDQIERRITQLATAKISISTLNDDGVPIDVKPFSFVESFRFCYDSSKDKNKRSDKQATNHVFIVLNNQLVEAIVDYPTKHFRKDQYKIANYNSLPLRSLIKWLTTNEPDYLHTKKMEWVIDRYIDSVATSTSASFRSKLKKELLSNAEQIEADYGLRIAIGSKGEFQFFNVNNK